MFAFLSRLRMKGGGSARASSAFFPFGFTGRGLSSTRKSPKRPVRFTIGTPAGERRSICSGRSGRRCRSTGMAKLQAGRVFGFAFRFGAFFPFVAAGASGSSMIFSL